MGQHIEIIECPECGKRQKAMVKHTVPFYTYIHDCSVCNHIIMESDWVLIDTLEEHELKLQNDE